MSSVIIAGDTSGSVTLQAPAVSGTTVITLPATSGTMALSGGAGSFTTVEVSSTIKGGSTIGVGGATPAASGAGITFPATQSASTNANTLDDYEEGTWTPGQGANLTVAGSFNSAGTYIKIGNIVYVNGYVGSTVSVAAAGQLVTGLPFTASNYGTGSCLNNAGTVGTTQFANGTTIGVIAAIGSTPYIYFSSVYQTS